MIKFFLALFLVSATASADDASAVERLSVFGAKESLPTRPGSAHVLTEKDLEAFRYNDIHQVLRSVPGVNVQEEDGFGLRPNIGLRGAHPHRSKKVTLMEDGVLIAPAPYSAPAAYYFPQMDKLESIEVFKGVPSTRFGPNSIGGAINMVTRSNPEGLSVGVTGGSFNAQKYDVSAGLELWGDLSLDLTRFETTGFKELPSQGNTGFVRNNVTLRWDKYIANREQDIIFKWNWSDEVSNETYAGLTDSDFQDNPYQRYAATELDQMTWTQRQLFFSYAISPSEDTRLRLKLYNHSFSRSWNKIVGFGGTNENNPSAALPDVLNNPNIAANNFYYRVLRGDANSGVLDDNRDLIDIGNNQRQYYSRGAQVNFDWEFVDPVIDHFLNLSFRFHQDGVDRFHESEYYNMINGNLELSNARSQEVTLLNQGLSEALTFALNYELSVENLTLNSVVRFEDINYELNNIQDQEVLKSSDELLAPGFGAHYQLTQNWGVLAGVNKGFTPVGPGQADNIDPEEAINYELGLRHTGSLGMELIGFFSDYQNLLGTCTQSGGCTVNQLDQRFNGGEASVVGVEFLLHKDFQSGSSRFPVRLNTTYSQAQFDNSFTSANIEWGEGDVVSGDPIPYIPELQSTLLLGWEVGKLSTFLNVSFLGGMADQAVAQNRQYIENRVIYGLAMQYKLSEQSKLRLRVDNITNETYAVSRRPFGLRPGRPLMAFLGVEFAVF